MPSITLQLPCPLCNGSGMVVNRTIPQEFHRIASSIHGCLEMCECRKIMHEPIIQSECLLLEDRGSHQQGHERGTKPIQ